MDADYAAFLESKAPIPRASGLDAVPELSPRLFPHQRDCVAFGLRQGRWGCFLDTGLGKTLIELEWAKHAAAASNGHALILAPLAVAGQIVREGREFGYDCHQVRSMEGVLPGISVCNYDRLADLDPAAFGAVALDESSILKSFTGKTTAALIEAFRGTRFRMAATATPAPNDHRELGQHSEFLGVMTANEMLSRFFINDTASASQKWRLKRHAEGSFWDWMAGWCRMAETPADFGHDGAAWVLPELRTHRHRAIGDVRPPAGSLFRLEVSATELHEVKRQTADARAAEVAKIIAALPEGEPALVWCDLDDEAKAILAAVREAEEVRGSHPADRKERVLSGFATGLVRILVTKPSVAGFGMNFQRCATMIFVGRSFSYEAWYQAVRRCWRFGQTRPVDCHLIVAEAEDQIGRVIARKAADHTRFKAAMSQAMRRAMAAEAGVRVPYVPTHEAELPTWLCAA